MGKKECFDVAALIQTFIYLTYPNSIIISKSMYILVPIQNTLLLMYVRGIWIYLIPNLESPDIIMSNNDGENFMVLHK